jgi:hypothetical protein
MSLVGKNKFSSAHVIFSTEKIFSVGVKQQSSIEEKKTFAEKS